MTMKITMENIGGITKPTSVILKKGLNIIKAPNATGKTSFMHAIQTLVLPEDELKNHPEFLNDFSNEGKVELARNGRTDYRKIRRVGNSLGVIGNAFYNNGGALKASLLSFAEPENEFLDAVLKGKPLDIFFEDFSDAKYYLKLKGWCKEKDYELARKLDNYRGLIQDLEEKEEEIEELEEELKTLEAEKKKITPAYNDLIIKRKQDKKTKELNEKRIKKNLLHSEISELKIDIENVKSAIPDLKKEIEILDKEINEFSKEHPDIDKEIDKVSDEITETKEMRNQIEGEIENFETEKEACEEGEINKKKCISCGRPYSLSQRKKRLTNLMKLIRNKKTEELELRQKVERFEDEKQQLIDDRDAITFQKAKERKEGQGELLLKERNLKDWNDKLNNKTETMRKLEKEIIELRKNIDDKTDKLMEQWDKLNESIGDVNGKINFYKDKVEELSESQEILTILQKKADFIKIALTYVIERIKQLKDAVRNKFNSKIIEVYKILGFKDFEKIEIDDMFRITVRRKKNGRITTQELNRLSTSERITIGVITMLAGKEEYLSDFPFFVLDEVTTAYDSKRFEKIVSYIQKHTPYTIVTTFSSVGEEIQVEYKN